MINLKYRHTFYLAGIILSFFLSEAVFCSEVTIHDQTPPKAMGKLHVVEIRSNQLKVSWEPAQDNVTPASQLRYRLVHSKNPSKIDQINEIKAMVGKSVDLDWSVGSTETLINDLTPSTKYGVMLAVKDESENIALYPMLMTQSGTGFQSRIHEKKGRHSVRVKSNHHSVRSQHENPIISPLKAGRG